jgi:hypothetical protein
MATKGKIREDVFNVHIRVNPSEQELLETFLFDFDVNYGRKINAANTALSAYLLQPHRLLEATFGFQDEILLVVSDHHSIQPRVMQAVEQIYSEQPYRGRADPLTFVLVSRDPTIESWISGYLGDHPQFRSPIVVSWEDAVAASDDRWFVRNKLSTQLFARDIFDYQLPLDNDMFFFGRGKLVDEMLDTIRKSQNTGLFGLRKTGKTSLLYKVLRTCQENKIANVIYVDCKRPNIRQLNWRQLLDYVTKNLSQSLNRPRDSITGDDEVSRFRNLLSSAPKNAKLAVIFDEIEYISPLSLLDKHWKRDYIDFWQTIWSVQSEIRKLSIVVAGVNPYMCEIDLINGVQNPMFGIVKDVMLTGLSKEETQSMIKRMGRQIGLGYEDTALEYMHQRYGGHPLLTRLACSFTNKAITRDEIKRPVQISKDRLAKEEGQRESDLQFYCRHVVSELKQFYEVEYQLLEKIARGEIVDFLEFAAEPEFIKHLKGYGLIAVDKSGRPDFKIPVIKRYIAFEAARQRKSGELRTMVVEGDRSDWVERRKDGILRDMKQFLRSCQLNGKPGIYGAPYLVEADQFASIKISHSWNDFVAFINAMNQTFVEPIDNLNGKKFFGNELRSQFPYLFEAFKRIKLLRHNADHLRLRQNIEAELADMLDADLFGVRLTILKEPWFMLQQICLDETFAAIQYERGSLEN